LDDENKSKKPAAAVLGSDYGGHLRHQFAIEREASLVAFGDRLAPYGLRQETWQQPVPPLGELTRRQRARDGETGIRFVFMVHDRPRPPPKAS